MASDLKGIPLAPLSGLLDLRSQPDLLPANALRMRQNLQTVATNTIRRGQGWSKLLSQPGYNNADFHDQLLLFGGSNREPVTMLAKIESSSKARWLFLATQSRIAKLNQATGNWQILGTGFGGGAGTTLAGARFQCDCLGDYVAFTNGVDEPMYYALDSVFTASQLYDGVWPNPNGNITPANQSESAQYFQESITPITVWNWDVINLKWVLATTVLRQFSDLQLINLTTARKCWVWRNCLFFADLIMDGQRYSYRFIWSDYNGPTSFDPARTGTISGYLDLDFGETILAAKPFADSLLIYTDRNVWQVYVINTAQAASTTETTTSVFGVQKLPGLEAKSCLRYENTLVAKDESHYYMGLDRIYAFNQYMARPDPLEWIHAADLAVYQNIRSDICQAHVACLHGNEIYFSVVTSNSTNGCPDVMLRVNTMYKTVDIVDSGFTAFCEYRPQAFPTIRDWIISQQICSPETLNSEGYGWTNEGLPNPIPPPIAPFSPTVFYTHATLTKDGVTTEDYNAPTAASDSLCALLAAEGFGALLPYCEQCNAPELLVGAHSTDWCLKQLGDTENPIFYRERCTNTTAVGTTSSLGYTSAPGQYVLDPYTSLLRTALMFSPKHMSYLSRILMNFLANSTGVINARIGMAGQVVDPNVPANPCIKWYDLSQKTLKCLTTLAGKLYVTESPNNDLEWNMLISAKFLFIEISVPGTGADVQFSGMICDVESKPIRY